MVFARRGVRDLHNFSAEYDWLLHEGGGEGEGQVDGERGSEERSSIPRAVCGEHSQQ